MQFEFPYRNWFDFLEQRMGDQTASAEELLILKKEYKRLYNNAYQRFKRKNKKIIHLAVSHREHKKLQRLADQNDTTLFHLLKRSSLNPKTFLGDQLIDKVQIAFVDICQCLEDMQAEEQVYITQELKEKIEKLNQSITQLEEQNDHQVN